MSRLDIRLKFRLPLCAGTDIFQLVINKLKPTRETTADTVSRFVSIDEKKKSSSFLGKRKKRCFSKAHCIFDLLILFLEVNILSKGEKNENSL